MRKTVRLTESDLTRIVRRVLNEQVTKTKMGDFDDEQLLQIACRSWSRFDNTTKKEYLDWSRKQIAKDNKSKIAYPYDLNVVCKVKAEDAINDDRDRNLLKAVIDLDFVV